jgi:hypothetical protein
VKLFAFFKKLINFCSTTYKYLKASSRKSAMKIENFEKKNHGRVKILGWSKKQHERFK